MIKILTTRKLLEKQKTKILGYQKGLLQIEKKDLSDITKT